MSRSLSIAHVPATATGRKLTPFVPRLNLRVGLENRKTAKAVPTLPTLPTGVAERGRKSTPPFAPTRAHWKSRRVGTVGAGDYNE